MTATEFNTNFNGLTNILRSFSYSLTNDSDDARDLYQETSFRAYKNIEKFRPGTNFKAWLMTIMKNIFINNYRRKVKQNTVLDHTDNNFYINSTKNMVTNSANTNIMMKELTGMIEELEDSIRVPFLMHYQGFKYKEIAEQFNLPLGTVKSRIFFARKALQEKVTKRYTRVEIALEN
ncbi:MAG: RNA polymerase sigma factor [Saprospiraceae bacterium]|nr:RNA polymerase sigma factor [Saprospiraceae bacterium]